MAKREISPVSMSFLDVMFCGFGAVVLLVMILNGDVLRKREHRFEDLRAELKRVTDIEELARSNMDKLQSTIAAVDLKQADVQGEAAQLGKRVEESRQKSAEAESRASETQARVGALAKQAAAVQSAVTALREKNAERWRGGTSPVGFSGDGQRQYLTGLKLGGERTLILLDSSASMLDETVVNVVRRKLMSPQARRDAPKWRRAVRTVHWLIANMRPGKQFQIYQFNTDAKPLVAGTGGSWISTDDAMKLPAAVSAAREIVPNGGTSLHRAFDVIRQLQPRPDSVIVLTDGLATQGDRVAPPGVVTAQERERISADAIRGVLSLGIPVNTLLFPMEGDPLAAGTYWKLAILTKGSFITPARDWP